MVAVVDGEWSVVGSANIDVRSNELNHENVVGILDRSLAGEIEEAFLEDLDQAEEITLDTWRRRGVWEHLKERFFVLFVEQY